MITAAIIQAIAEDETLGLIIDRNLFWEELPLAQDGGTPEGVWVVTRGGSLRNTPNGINCKTTLDFYITINNKAKMMATHESILGWIRDHRTICSLSGAVGDNRFSFTNIRITPTTTPQNQGATENGNIVMMASADVVFDQT